MIITKLNKFLQPTSLLTRTSLNLLLLRIVVGAAFIIHGWAKMQNPAGWMGSESSTPGFLQFLASVSEFGGGIAWILGLITPIASLGIASTMTVAVFKTIAVMNFPFVNLKGGGSYELPLTYFCIAILFMVTGPGKFSLDYMIFKGRTGIKDHE
ncbi:MAG TPA: DoxX family protein [Ignavibacteria bacterium]